MLRFWTSSFLAYIKAKVPLKFLQLGFMIDHIFGISNDRSLSPILFWNIPSAISYLEAHMKNESLKSHWWRMVQLHPSKHSSWWQKTSSRRLGQDQNIRLGHTSSRHLQDVLQRYLQDVFKTYHQVKLFLLTRFQDVFQKYSKSFWDALQRWLSIEGFA